MTAVGGLMLFAVSGCRESVTTLPVARSPTEATAAPGAREWVAVTAHPCALDSAGLVTCWGDLGWYGEIGEPLPVDVYAGVGVELVGQRSHLYGHRVGESLRVLVSDSEGSSIWDNPPSTLLDQTNVSMGIPPMEDVLYYWEGNGEHRVLPGRGWYLVSQSQSFAADAENRIVFGSGGYLYERSFAHSRELTDFVGSWQHVGDEVRLSACGLALEGDITCIGEDRLGQAVFENGPYRFIDGDRGIACAVRAEDDVIECNTGEVLDFGLLRDVDVAVYPERLPDGGAAWAEPSICAITEGNAIRCSGSRYTPELLDVLDALPR